MNENEKQLLELIKETYGDCSSVRIFTNCQEFTVEKTYPQNLEDNGFSMRNIKGEFVNEKLH